MNDKTIEEKYGAEDNIVLPRFIWESSNASHERTVKRFIIALVVAIFLLAATNAAWLYVWNQYDFSSEDITVETTDDGATNLLGAGANANGVINNGNENKNEAKDDN